MRTAKRIRRSRAGLVAIVFAATGLFATSCAGISADPPASQGAVATTTTTPSTMTTTATTTTTTAAVAARSDAASAPRRGVVGAIAVVGDSLSAQSETQETAQLKQAGWSVVVNAQSGRRVTITTTEEPKYSGVIAVDDVRANGSDPHTWVVELGTNDIGNTGNDATAMRALIETMLAKIGPGHEIIWINIHHGGNLTGSAMFNRVLAEVAATRADLIIGDWAGIATDPGYLIYDQVHLTASGQAAMASLIVETTGRASFS